MAGYSQLIHAPVDKLYEIWFAKQAPAHWIPEAMDLYDGAARRVGGHETKAERQKILADFNLLEEKWPHSLYAESARHLSRKI